MVEPDCSLVRGTSTFQPNSGLVSNHDSCSRMATVDPTTARAGNSTVFMASRTSPRVVTRVAWRIVVPRSVSATGVSGARPASSRLARAPARSSGAPRRTTVTLSDTDADQSTLRSLALITWTAGEVLEVSGTPAYAGTAETALTPGTTSKPMPALWQASASSASPLNVAGSPSMSRTTSPPGAALAALTTSLARDAWVRGCPWSPWPASMISTPSRQWRATTSSRATWSMTTTSAAARY